MNYSRILTLSMYALVIIAAAASLFNWKLLENPVEGSIYNGSLNSGWVPESYMTYKALTGRLVNSKITIMTEHYVGVGQKVQIPSNATALALTMLDTGWKFYFVTGDNKLIADNRYDDIMDSTVYVQGNVYNLRVDDGRVLHMIEPIEVTVEPVTDLVETSETVIRSIVGDSYFDTYFSRPVLWKDDYYFARMYRVEYVYGEPEVDDRYRSVALYYNSDRKLVDQGGIPDESSLQPFKVTKQEAIEIARAGGFPKEGNVSATVTTYTHPDEWPSPFGNITVQTFFDPAICAKPVNLTHYVWHVQLNMPSEDANTRMYKYAIVDTKTGKLYTISEYRIGSISIWFPPT